MNIMEQKAHEGLLNNKLTPNGKLLYFVLCSGADQIDGGHWINVYTQDKLRSMTGMASKGTLQSAIKNLVENDLIQIMKRKASNIYVIK